MQNIGTSTRRVWTTACILAFFGALASPPVGAQSIMTRVSVGPGGAQGNAHSDDPRLSADGRFVVFSSFASNLVTGDTNAAWDVFVHDRQTGTTTRVSEGAGGAQGNGHSFGASLSADGRFVAFASEAANLVIGDTNGACDIFVHDRQTSTTSRVSLGPGGLESDGSDYYSPGISADGRFVAFSSYASNLVTSDTNGAGDVFVHDRQNGITTRVSLGPGELEGNSHSYFDSLSADGRFIVFSSFASNLVTGDTNGAWDVFVHDRQTGTTTRVSVGAGGAQGEGGSFGGALSADGRFVAFASDVAFDVNDCCYSDVYLHDRETGTTTWVSASLGSWGDAWEPDLSADGRFVAFSYHWDPEWFEFDTGDVYVYDREGGSTTLASVSITGSWADDETYYPTLSANGQFVAFSSGATNLVVGDTNAAWDVFMRDGGSLRKSTPTNQATGRPTTVSLRWSSVWFSSDGAAGYEYCYDTSDNDACDATWMSATSNEVTITGLENGTAYFWQVRFGTTYADDGHWWGFRTAPLPGLFAKSSPTNGATQVPVSLTLSWTASSDASTYDLCVDTINNNACDVMWIERITGTSKNLIGLAGGMTFYWQVRAHNAQGTIYADGGAWWSFTTTPSPGGFWRLSPLNGATPPITKVTLGWTSSAGATSYEYCVDTVDNSACDATWTRVTGTTQAVAGLTAGTTYYWHVRATNAGGTTYAAPGTWWSFKTIKPPAFDFFGAGRSDVAFWRPDSGVWYIKKSATSDAEWAEIQWGVGSLGDQPVSADYDGDGMADIAIWRESTGTWFVRTSSSNFDEPFWIQWGAPGDRPVPGDYDGDGKADLAVWRPENGYWFIKTSTTGYASYFAEQWGVGAFRDVPLPGDYDGDGRTDLAVWRPDNGVWYVRTSSSGYSSYFTVDWGVGLLADVPVVGDFDGDGRADAAVWRPDPGVWFVKQSSTSYTTWFAVQWGVGSLNDVPVVADFDGDGRSDIAVWRPDNGYWFIKTSASNYSTYFAVQWGAGSLHDRPIGAALP